MAVQAAHNLSKQDILAGYLNDSFFGNGAWGIEAAAETYFNTTAAKLTLLQAATLAGIVENPTAYDPIHNPATALERRNTVLARIAATHPVAPAPTAPRLTAAAAAAAMKQKLALHVGNVQSGCSANTVGDDAFFCDYVDARRPAGRPVRRYHAGQGQAARHRRAAHLHHARPAGPGRGHQRRQPRPPGAQRHVQPGAERRHRGADTAGDREGHGDRRRPAVRHRQRPDRGRLRGQQPVRRPGRRADRFIVQAVHPDHGARPGRALRLPADRERPGGRAGVHQLRRAAGRCRPANRPGRRLPRGERRRA